MIKIDKQVTDAFIAEMGLSDKGKNKIRHVLADSGRNLSISKSYLSYLK
jgi:hypothetical protein